MRYRLLLTLALAGPLLVQCSDDDGPTAHVATPRTYRMGFSAIPPRADLNLTIQTINLWSSRADAALMLSEPPWEALLAGGGLSLLCGYRLDPLHDDADAAAGHHADEAKVALLAWVSHSSRRCDGSRRAPAPFSLNPSWEGGCGARGRRVRGLFGRTRRAPPRVSRKAA